MSAASLAKYLYLAYLSKPAAPRSLVRTVRRNRVGQVLLFGLGDGQLARNLIEVAQRYATRERVTFFGVDLFEMGGSTHSLSLKQAHQQLKPTGAHVRLMPGDPLSVLQREANSMTDTDLVVISGESPIAEEDRAWMYVPRVLSKLAVVLCEQPGRDGQPDQWTSIARSEVERRAAQHAHRRAA